MIADPMPSGMRRFGAAAMDGSQHPLADDEKPAKTECRSSILSASDVASSSGPLSKVEVTCAIAHFFFTEANKIVARRPRFFVACRERTLDLCATPACRYQRAFLGA
jgi:hypothetical protein